MRLWQQGMITLARSKTITRAMHGSRFMNTFSRQFVAGANSTQAVERGKKLKSRSISASMFFLGEYIDDPALAEENVQALLDVIPKTAQAGLDLHVSVDPTQIGSLISWDLCRENAARIADAMQQQDSVGLKTLMIDMEDSGVTQGTLDVYDALHSQGAPVSITIQAYLHRSAEDIEKLAKSGAMVRLVKGAFAEPPDIAYVTQEDKDEQYRRLLTRLFSPDSRDAGTRPVLGTHDEKMIDFAKKEAEKHGWPAGDWEVEMLLGVRPALQKKLVSQGVTLRLYCPFGESWWPYSIRRIGENPRNMLFVLRSILGGVFASG